MNRPDSAQILATIGSVLGFVVANFDRLAASACALAGLGYTLWKWRKEARAEAAAAAANTPAK